MKYLLGLAAACILISCGSENAVGDASSSIDIDVPCMLGGEPNLHADKAGNIFLSWVEFIDDTTDALFYARLADSTWTDPVEISRGSDWFVNWADFPSLCSFGNGALAAHWLQKSAAGTYDYDVRVSISDRSNSLWRSSFILHRDSVSAEHGFVSMIPMENGRILATWLDGRNTKSEGGNGGHDHHSNHGAMTLRAAEFDDEGNIYEEYELDDRVCDCCQTDVAMSSRGPVVVYRDRSADEVRDISIVRRTQEGWTEPSAVHNDNWEIAGCPVNGPSVVAVGDHVWVVWYTGSGGTARVYAAHSPDAGETFGDPIAIDGGSPLGRVDACMASENSILVCWLEDNESDAEIRIKALDDNGNLSDLLFEQASDASRSSGFPRIAPRGDGEYILAWTEVGEQQRVRSSLIRIR